MTCVAMLPYLWLEGTENDSTQLKLLQYADSLYGAVVRTSLGKRANLHILESYVGISDERIVGEDGLSKRAAKLLLELVAQPAREAGAFVSNHVRREIALHRKRIENVQDDKAAYAMERCMEEMCAGHAVGLPRLGYLEQLPEVTPQRLWDTYQDVLAQSEIHVYLVGPMQNPDELVHDVITQLSTLLPVQDDHRIHSTPLLVPPVEKRHRDVLFVGDTEDINQGKLNLGFTTGKSIADADYVPMMIANGILGGFPHSKLFVNVREKANLAYYASSRLDGLSGILSIQTGIAVDKYDKALEIILEQIEALKSGAVSEEELLFTRRGLVNQYVQALDTPMAMVEIHFGGILAGVKRDIPVLMEQVNQVKHDDLVEAVQSLSLDTVYFLGSKEVAHA